MSLPNENVQVDFLHFIKLAKANIMTWDSLSKLLNETAQSIVLAKRLNQILLEELKLSEAKQAAVNNGDKSCLCKIVESNSIRIQTEAPKGDQDDKVTFKIEMIDTKVEPNVSLTERVLEVNALKIATSKPPPHTEHHVEIGQYMN